MAIVTFCQHQHLGLPFRLLIEASVVAKCKETKEVSRWVECKGMTQAPTAERGKYTLKSPSLLTEKVVAKRGEIIHRGPPKVHQPTTRRHSTRGILVDNTSVAVSRACQTVECDITYNTKHVVQFRMPPIRATRRIRNSTHEIALPVLALANEDLTSLRLDLIP